MPPAARRRAGSPATASTMARSRAACTSSSAEPHRQVAEEGGPHHHDPDRTAQCPERVAADPAGLDEAELARLQEEEVGDAVDGAIDDARLDDVIEEARQGQARADEDAIVQLIAVVLCLD